MKRRLYPIFYFSLIAVSAIYLIIIIFNYPLVGLKVTPTNGNLCAVSEVYPYGWASYHNIKKDDLIYCEQDTNSAFKLEKIEQIYFYTEQNKTYKIVSYKGIPSIYLMYTFLPILYFVISFSIAVYLYFKNQSEKLTIITSFLLLFISLGYLSSGVSARGDVLGLFITTLSLYLIPVFLLAYLNFMVQKKHQLLAPRGMKIFLGFMFLIAIVTTLFEYTELILAFFVLLILFVLFFFIKHYNVIKKSIHFVKMKLFFWTIVFSLLPFILLSAIPEILLGKPLLLAENTALFLLFIPLSLVYVTKQKVVFDFDFFVKKFMLNFSLSIIPGLILAGLLYMKEENSLHAFQFLLISIALIIIILFLKDYFFCSLHKGQGKFQSSITKFSQATNQINDVQSLFLYINQIIYDVLQIGDVNILHYHVVHKYFCTESTIEDQSLLRLLKRSLKIGDVKELDFGYALLVGKSSSIYTFITFPYKKKMMKLNKEEKDWLITIAHYINLMLENFKKTDELITEMQNITKTNHSLTISRTLFLLGEKERSKLAQDIHDSILQELISLHQNIEFIQNSGDGSSDLIERIRIQVNEQIGFIRDACFDLDPPFLIELGLLESISILLDKYRKSNEFDIYFQCNTPKQYAHLNEEMTIILYRTVQELMNNAKKHSEAKYIYISLSYSRDQFILVYEDDGVGFDFHYQSENIKHFGLFNIRERIKSIDGETFINSTPGQGFLFRATIPNHI